MTEEPKQVHRAAQGNEEKGNSWGKVVGFFLAHPTVVLSLLYVYGTAIGLVYSWVLYGKFGISIFDYSEIGDFLLAAFKNPLAFVPPVLLVALGATMLALQAYATRRATRREERELRDFLEISFARLERSGRIKKTVNDEETVQDAERIRQLAKMISQGDKEHGDLLEDLRRSEEEAGQLVRRWQRRLVLNIALGIVFFSLVVPYYSASKTASSIKDGENPKVDVRYGSFSSAAGQVTEPGLELIGATQKAVFFYDVDDKRTLVIPQAQIVSMEVPD